MTADLLAALPARQGHFLLESGYHADRWLTLDALFVDSAKVAPLVAALADRLRSHGMSAVCGPLLGGAFLAQALASTLGLGFYYTEPGPVVPGSGLFTIEYRLPLALQRRIRGERVAVTDDVLSAGSSVRATMSAIAGAGASTTVVGALLVLGDTGADHFAKQGVPVETLGRCPFTMWKPSECPLCREGHPLEDPRDPQSIATGVSPPAPKAI